MSATLASLLRQVRWGQTLWAAIRLACLGVAVLVGFVLVACVVDRFIDLPKWFRAPWPWLVMIGFWGFVFATVIRMAMQPGFDLVARQLDAASGDNRGHLRNLLHLTGRDDVPAFFVGASQAEAERRWQGRSADEFVDKQAAKRMAGIALGIIVLAAVLAMLPHARTALLLQRFADPWGNYPRPTATWFEVAQTPEVVRSGDDMLIRATLAGRQLDDPLPLIHIANADGSTLTRKLTPTDGAGREWQLQLPGLRQDFDWHLSLDSARSEARAVTVLPRPTISQVHLTYDYPAYSRIESTEEVLQGRTITALEGTRIAMEITSNVPLEEASGTAEVERLRFRVDRDEPTKATRHIILNREMQLAIDLLSTEGVPSKHELPFKLRPIADKPPSLSILNELDGESFYLTDTLEIRWKAQDDLGLAAVYVKAEPDEGQGAGDPVLIELELPEYGAKTAAGLSQIPLQDLYSGKAPFLKLSLVAKDMKDQDGESRVVTIELASDSLDRQLRQMLLSYEGSSRSREMDKRGLEGLTFHENRARAIKAIRNRLMILADTAPESEPLGEAHQRTIGAVKKELDGLWPKQQYGSFWSFDFQYGALMPRYASYVHYMVAWSYLAVPTEAVTEPVEAALASKTPKAALNDLLPRLDALAEREEAVQAIVAADHKAVVRELVGYLAATSARALAGATDADWRDRNFLVQHKAVVEEVQRRAAAHLSEEVSADDLAALQSAAAQPDMAEGLQAAQPVLASVAATLQPNALEAVRQRAATTELLPHDLVRKPMKDARRTALHMLPSGLYFAGDNVGADDVLLFNAAMAYLGVESEQYDAINQGPPGQLAAVSVFMRVGDFRRATEAFRQGITRGALERGLPETESKWLTLREARLALVARLAAPHGVPDSLRKPVQALVDATAPVDGWLPPGDAWTVGFTQKLRGWEQQAGEVLIAAQPHMLTALDTIAQQMDATARPMTASIASYRQAVADELTRLGEEKSIQRWRWYALHDLKMRLAALNMTAMKLADFAETAQLHGVKNAPSAEAYAAQYVGLAHAMTFFETDVEATAWTLAVKKSDNEWLGQMEPYKELDEKLALLPRLAPQGRDAIDEAAVEQVMKTLNAGFAWRMEREAVAAARDSANGLAEPKKFLTSLLDSSDRAALAWAEIYYRVWRLQAMLAEEGTTQEIKALAEEGHAWTQAFELPSRELREVADWLQGVAQGQGGNAAAREELAERGAGLLAALKPVIAQKKRLRLPMNLQTGYKNLNLELSALGRAKYRMEVQMNKDARYVDRVLASMAIGEGLYTPVDLTWAVDTREWNRRKAGVTLNRVGLGGLSVSGDSNLNVNLPRHIYLELKRAREKAMPPLFQDKARTYLNQVLEQARE